MIWLPSGVGYSCHMGVWGVQGHAQGVQEVQKWPKMLKPPENLKNFLSWGAFGGGQVVKKVVLRGSDTKLDLPEVS